MKAVWFEDAFLRSGWPRGPGKAFENVGGEGPHIFEGFLGPPGPARPQKSTQQNPARLPSGTQKEGPVCRNRARFRESGPQRRMPRAADPIEFVGGDNLGGYKSGYKGPNSGYKGPKSAYKCGYTLLITRLRALITRLGPL